MLPPSGEYLGFANELAEQAHKITGKYFRQSLTIQDKSDLSPVTIADQQTESYLREMILTRYPDHAITGEEHGRSGDSPWQWIIDPIDGTRSFISGFPVFCTLIALLYQEEVVMSMIDMPQLDERFVAAHDRKTTLNGREIHTAKKENLIDAIIYSTDPSMFNAEQFAHQERLSQACKMQRWSGDGYLYGMLAAGWIDLVVEADLKPYDFLPLKCIVEQAGGVITDWQGTPLSLSSNGEVLASANHILHAQALERLQ